MQNQLTPANTFDHLFSLERIEKQHVEQLSKEERTEFQALINYKLANLEDNEREQLILKISALLDKDMIWENNHIRITNVITEAIQMYGAMPSNAEIARKTGLSRSTVREHLNNYTHNPLHKEQEPIYDLMNEKVVAVIMKEALKGNMQAARLYLDVQSKGNKAGKKEVIINNQHNYIQINNTVLSQQTLQQLKPEQLLQIEQLIQKSLSEKLE